ncbi:P-loop NTPase fold protein [Acaryochloris sp. IP29b_bin.148]|uniref:P-loop NTPase fold protein n=1 Tax=Acaryochloris sp. IP29b_bin.148 TaxID=2969218 RepID=UPI002621823E|nr:P-loop NTPase fold protein [Acaryochloris sp. IP29b_bin.148]
MEFNFKEYKYGMSRKEAEIALGEFLKLDNPAKIFAVKGDWGVGKTHLVRDFLSHVQKSYYYGSVFGVSTVEDLKMQLWSNFNSNSAVNHQNKKWSLRDILPRANKNSKDLGQLVEAFPKMEDYGIGFTPALITLFSNFIINSSLQDKLICIDDIERREQSLSLKNILGFVENLAKHKNCKIIIIYNENKTNEDPESKTVLSEYKEKVIDFEIKLDPSFDENFFIGFGEGDPDKDLVLDYFSKTSTKINNIRVLNKIKLNIDKLRPSIKDFLPEVRKKIIDEVIFMTLAKFDIRFQVDLDALMSIGSFQNTFNQGREPERELYLNAINLGYTGTIVSDEIFRLIETYICNYKTINIEGKKLNDIEENHKIDQKLTEAYAPYSESFEACEKDLHKSLNAFLEENNKFLSFQKIVGLKDISCAVNLDIEHYWNKWFEYHINQAKDLEELYDLQSILEAGEFIINSSLHADLYHKISRFSKEISIDSVLIKIVEERGWSQRDAHYLDSQTLDQWKEWLLVRDPDKVYMIRKGLEMPGKSSQTLKQAIIELAQDSDLNKMRAEKLYKISL